MELDAPDEPKKIKEMIVGIRLNFKEDTDTQGIDYDMQAVWEVNLLPKYLWKYWKNELIKNKISWQKFLKILRARTIDFVEWALYDNLEWEELMQRVMNTIETYAF